MFKSKTVGYISKVDEFLTQFNRSHALSKSQNEEVKQYQRVYKLRDQAVTKSGEISLWENF